MFQRLGCPALALSALVVLKQKASWPRIECSEMREVQEIRNVWVCLRLALGESSVMVQVSILISLGRDPRV